MTGRSRALGSRARPHILAEGEREQMSESEVQSSSSSENGATGNGSEPAARGRGGLRADALVTRPPNITVTTGTGGGSINLYANYFRVIIPGTGTLFQYHVEFEPNIENTRMRRGLVHCQAQMFGDAYVYDGMASLQTVQNIDTPCSFVVNRNDDNTPITITLNQVGTVSFGSHEMLRLYNTQMRRNLGHIGLDLIGRYFYEKRPVKILPEHGGVAIFRGYVTAVNKHDGGILTVTDSIFKFVRNETLYQLMRSFHNIGADWKQKTDAAISGQIVLTKYNNKTYRCDRVSYDSTPGSTFDRRGEEITFHEYYRQAYQININDHEQPLVIGTPTERDSRTGEKGQPVLLVPELCNITGLTDRMRSDHRFMQSVAKCCKLPPVDRMSQLKEFIDTVNGNEKVQAEMGRWGVRLDDTPVKLRGRILDPENLLMGNGSSSKIVNAEFQRTLRGKTLYKAVSFSRWIIVFPKRESNLVETFRDTMKQVAAPMGIEMDNPRPFIIENDRPATYATAIRNIPREAQLVVIIVPNDNKERYDTIKQILCLQMPIPSQVVVTRTLLKKGGMMSVCTKIAIQVACKGGAEPWALEIPPKKIMVAGFDTYHDSSVRGRSAGGFVCSTNQKLTRYYSRVCFHENREEMSKNLALCVVNGIEAYKQINGEEPERVILYRDGVGDGMIPHVYNLELPLVKKGIDRLGSSKKIHLTYIIVTKRINTRFFASRSSTPENPPPGTIVDDVVTRKDRYDFFLVSQTVNEGTVAPTMFDIICDESGWSATNQQKLAYKMTHLYYNWSGTVKVPAPCQYAHKLAFLSGQSLHKEVPETLRHQLYFL